MGFSALDETINARREKIMKNPAQISSCDSGGGAEQAGNSSSSIAILFLVVYHSQQSVGIHKTEYTGL